MNRSRIYFHRVALACAAWFATAAFSADRTMAKPPPGEGPLAGPRHRPAPPPAESDEMERAEDDGFQPGEPGGPRGRMRDRGDRWPRRMEGDGPLNERMIERVMGELKNRLPQWHERLARLQTEDPEKFQAAMRRMMPMLAEARRLGERNPKLAESMFEEFQIEHELRGLAERYKAATAAHDEAQLGQIASEIDTRVRHQFEIRRMRRQAQLDEFARRLAEQQKRIQEEIAEHAEQGAKAEEFISKRIEEIKKGEFRGPSLFGGRGRPGPGRPGGPDGEFGPRGPRRRGMRPPPGEGPMSERGPGPGGPHHDGPPPPDDMDGPPHDGPPMGHGEEPDMPPPPPED